MKTSTIRIGIAATSILVILGLIIIIAGSFLAYSIGVYNNAKIIKNTYEAKISANMTDFDNLKKTISQTAQVSQAQMEKLENIYVQYAEARTGNEANSAIMRWVQESVPNVDTSTFNNLQNIIVSTRAGWTARQRELVDLSREYNKMLEVFPSNIILTFLGFEKIDPKIITSQNTKESFKTGEDNNTQLF